METPNKTDKDSSIKSTVDAESSYINMFRVHVTTHQGCSYLFSSISLHVAEMSLGFFVVYFFHFQKSLPGSGSDCTKLLHLPKYT